jgi:CysZ protein
MNNPLVAAAGQSTERPGFRAGLKALFDGYRYLFRKPDVWPLAIIPVFVALILASIFGVLSVKGALWLVAKYMTHENPSALWTVALILVNVLAVLMALFVALFGAFALGKPLSGPVLERLVRRVSVDLGAPEWPTPTLWQDVFRSLQSTFVALVFTLPILIPLVIIGLIFPVAAVVTTPLQFIVTGIGAAWDFCDYPLSIRGTSVSERMEFVRRNIRAVLGFGLGLGLLLLLPCSLLLVLPAGVIGAAHLTVLLEKWEADAKKLSA